MNEIVTDILTWAWFSAPHGYNFNGYLVRHPGATSASIRYRRTTQTLPKSFGRASQAFSLPIATIRERPTWCVRAPPRRR